MESIESIDWHNPSSMIGKRFGSLTVKSFVGTKNISYPKGERYVKEIYECMCDCGRTAQLDGRNLVKGRANGCGHCGNATRTHGQSKTRLYRIWCNMHNRCYNTTANSYKNYGGRGITVCKEWNDDFMVFYDWAIRSGYKSFLTLDRINPDLGYCPENCRWATKKEQANNRRNNKKITFDGQTHTLAEWETITGVDQYNIYNRIQDGWTIKDTLTIPVKEYKCRHKRGQDGSLQHTEED